MYKKKFKQIKLYKKSNHQKFFKAKSKQTKSKSNKCQPLPRINLNKTVKKQNSH